MEEKIDKIYKLAIASVVLLAIILLLNLFGGIKVKEGSSTDSNNTQSTTSTTTTENTNYDVSKFNSLSLSDLLKLFDDKKNTYVVYLGRATCSACVSFVPTLNEVQEKYGYTTQYLDITTVDSQTDDFEKLMDKLSKKVKLTVNGETQTQAFGDYYGYTPMVFVIKDGKFADGFVGAYSKDKLITFLNDNGIK